MKKIMREYKHIVELEGGQLLEHRHLGSGHIALILNEGIITAPSSPSSRRNIRIVRALIRRLLK